MTTAVTYKKFSGVSTEPESIVTPFKPKIDSFSITDSLTDYYSIHLEWSGSFVKTVLYYNTTNSFNLAVDNSFSFVTETSTTVTGLSPATNYYFKIFSFGTGNFSKGTRTVFTQTKHLPVITRINSTAIDTSSISVNWQGIFETVNLVWSETVSFDTILGTITDISGNTQDISGLMPNTKYYIKAKPIGLDAYDGSYSSTVISRTLFNPAITSTNIKKIQETAVMIEWNGQFNKVDIQYDISDTFMDSPTTYSNITKNFYNFTDLLNSTTYYFRVLPYKNAIAGEYGATASATTLSTTPDVSVSYIYIDTYVSGVDSSNITVTWDASYISMDLHLNSTEIFSDVVDNDVDTDIVVTDLSGTTTYTFMGLMSNTKYYVRATPYTTLGVASSNQYLTEYTLPTITDISSINTTSSETIISWDGSFDVVNILYNTTGTFGVSDLSFAGQNESPAEITGLTSNTKYYFRIMPYSNAGTAGTPSSIIYTYTKPNIVSVSCEAIDNSSITVHWFGSGDTVDILWNETGVFGISDNSVNNIDIADQSKRITGLNSAAKYYFKVRPYSSNNGGIYGEYSEFTSEFTLYTPFISSVTGIVIDNSSVIVAWDGSFAMVDLLWDLSGTFTSLVGSSTDVSLNQYTITGLSASTKYHVKITPKAATYSGTSNMDTSAITLYTPVVSSLTTSQIKPTSVAINWTGTAYSAVDIKWGLTDGFTTNVGSATDISNVLSYTVSGLSPSTMYYFTLTPKGTLGYGNGFYNGTKSSSSASTTYDPSITAITVSTVDNSAVLVGWTGTYSTVNIMYNKTGLFQTATTYSSKTGVTGSSNVITGLDSSTNYYFVVRPYSNTGLIGTDSSMSNIVTYYTPIINKFMGYVYDSSSIILSWTGLYSTVNILWDISNVIVQTSGTVSGATGNTTTISGLYNKGDYNFKIVPVSRGILGTTSAITIAKNNYNPVINSISAISMGISSIMVEWVGNYTSVSVQYNDSGVFTNTYTTISGVVSSFYTITGLSSSTTYYFRVLPYYDTTMGLYSSTVSAATSKPPRSYKLTTHPDFMSSNTITNYSSIISIISSSSSGQYVMTTTPGVEGVIFSKDYGNSWTRLPLPFMPNNYANYCVSPSGKWLLYMSQVNPFNSVVQTMYQQNAMYFFYSSDYGITWGEFPYNSIYKPPTNETFNSEHSKLRINDSGECIIGLTINRGDAIAGYIHYVFYTKDFGTNIQIITANNATGHGAVGLFDCDKQMTKLVYLKPANGNTVSYLYSMTAPFSTSANTLISTDSLLYYRHMVMSEDGSTFIITIPSSPVIVKVYTYSNSAWSLLRTVSVSNMTYNSIHINYDASRIVFKYNASIWVSYNKFNTYSLYYTPSSFESTFFCSPSNNSSMFIIPAKGSIVTTNNFLTTTSIYTVSYVSPGLSYLTSYWEGKSVVFSFDYKYIYFAASVNNSNSIASYSRLFYSNDYGESFSTLNSYLTTIAPTSTYDYTMPVCSSTGEIIYLMIRNKTTSQHNIIKSVNRGLTWILIKSNIGDNIPILGCDPTGQLVLTRYLVSVNGGTTWTENGNVTGFNTSPQTHGEFRILSSTQFISYSVNYGVLLTTYNSTTNTFNYSMISTFKMVNLTASGLGWMCSSTNMQYVYCMSKQCSNGRGITLYKSSNYGSSYTELFNENAGGASYSTGYSQVAINCSDDGSIVMYTYSYSGNGATMGWVGISKDYGVTFNKKLMTGGFNNMSLSSCFTLSSSGDNYSFWNKTLIINSPNLNAASSSYINAYISDISSTTTIINWDPSYSKVDINRNQTNLFDVNDTTLSGIISTTSQIISGLSPNTKYYFRITPYIAGVATTKQYTNITTLATVTSLTASTSDTSGVGLVWDGSFSTVAIYYNTSGTFTTNDASLSGITTKTRTVSGLAANTLYYFRLMPVSSSATNGIVSSVVSKYTTPSITSKSTSISGLTTINVSITGLYAYYTLKWNTTGVFDVSDSSASNITTSSYSVTDLNIETIYYFKATPVGTSGIVGTTTDVFQATTPYVPTITDISCYTVTNSSVIVLWDGSFNNVDIYWDLNGTFVSPVGSKTTVSGNSNTITGLSSSTLYYFKVVPKYDTFAGTAGTIVSTTTYYNPVLSTLTSTSASTSQINLAWDGSFTGVLIKYNTTNIFDTSGAVFTALTFTTETTHSLTGLSPATVYYFRAVPQGTTGFNSTTVYNTNSTTDYLPVLADISAVAIDTSSVTVTIAGLYENANIDYNDSGNYTNSYNTISTTTNNTVINGLTEKTVYYFRVKPVGLRGLSGSYTSTKSVKTLYLPTLSYVFYLTLSKSEISLDYDGSFTSVSIVYDTSSSFAVSPTTITGITTPTYILSGLQNNTKYYLKMLPYVLSVSGEYSTVSTATTNKAASADYEKYLLFDVNFNKSNLVGGVAKENVSGSLSGLFGYGIVTSDKRLYVNSTYYSFLHCGYRLTRNVTLYNNFITYSLWVNIISYNSGLQNTILHLEQPWNDINSVKCLDLRVSSSGIIEYLETYGGVGGGTYTFSSSGVVPLNSWTHVALCIDVTNAITYFYINGVYYPMITTNVPNYDRAKSSRLNGTVGAYITGVHVGLGGNCYIDNVKIYKTTAAIDLAGINAIMTDGAVYSSLSSTPVLYYPFDGDYNDYSSGSAISNATIYSADIYNQASISSNYVCGMGSLSLNRIYTQYIKLSSFSIDTSGLTVCGWANTTQTNDNTTLFQLKNGNATIYLCCISGLIKLIVINSSGTVISTITTDITPSVLFTGTWFHYAITIGYSGTNGATSTYTLYINGNYYMSSTAAYPIQGLYDTNYIGYNNSTGTYTSLLCDNFIVYTYPLNSTAITTIYNTRSIIKDSVNNKLVYYYKFILKDISGNVNLKNYGLSNGYDGSTLSTNAAYSSVSKFNVVGRGSLRCGNGSYIIHRNFKAFTYDGMTCAFWIKIDATSIGSGFVNPIGIFGGNSSNAFLLELSINTTTGYLQNSPYMYVYKNGSTSFSSSSPTVPTGKTNNFTNWTHLCYVFYKNYTILYINNVPYKIAFSWNGWETYTGTSSFIGSTNSSYFNGYMDDIRIYNTSLSHPEVTALYNYDGITEPNNSILTLNTTPIITYFAPDNVSATPSSVSLTYTGSYSKVNIYYSTVSGVSVSGSNYITSTGFFTTTATITGLTTNTVYYFKVVPFNNADVVGATFATELAASTNGTVSSFTLGSVTTSSVSFTYSGTYSSVRIYYGTVSGATVSGGVYITSVGASTTTATVTGLTAGNTYYFTAVPVNSTGNNGATFETELTTSPISTVTSFAMGTITSSSVAFTYTGSYSSVRIYYGTVSGATVSGGVYITSTGASTTTATVTGLTANTRYYFTVIPFNGIGVSGTVFATETTTITYASISSFAVGSVTTSGATITYAGTYSSVRIYYGTVSSSTISGGVYITSTGASTTTATVSGLSSDKTYYFDIVPINSANVTGTTSLPTPFDTLLTSKAPWGRYSAASCSGTTMTDLTGNGRHATITGSYTTGTQSGNRASASIPYINGTTSTQILWPVGSIPNNFTICSITRYTNTNYQNRILTSYTDNSLYGHWATRRGAIYTNANWISNAPTENSSINSRLMTDWLSTCVKTNGTIPYNILFDGSASGIITTPSYSSPNRLSINNIFSYTNEISEWGFSHLIIWDQALTDAEMVLVSNTFETYLSTGLFSTNTNTQLAISPVATATSFTMGSVTSSSVAFTYAGSYSSVRIYYGTVSGATVSGGVYITSTGFSTSTATVTGLSGSTTYYFTLVPINGIGAGGTTFATELTASTPATITSFVMGNITSSSVAFTYSGSYSNVRIYYGTVSGSTVSGGIYITSSGASTTTATITGLTPTITYYFTIIPINIVGAVGTIFATQLTTTIPTPVVIPKTAIITGANLTTDIQNNGLKSSQDGSIIMTVHSSTAFICISRNSGQSWEHTGFKRNADNNFGVSPDGQKMVILYGTNATSQPNSIYVFVSSDSGRSWTNVSDNCPVAYLGWNRLIPIDEGIKTIQGMIGPSNSGAFMFGTQSQPTSGYLNNVILTKDFGTTFSSVATSSRSDGIVWMTGNSTLSRIAYIVSNTTNNGTVRVSDNGGVTFTDLSGVITSNSTSCTTCFMSGDGNTLVVNSANSAINILYYSNGAWTSFKRFTFASTSNSSTINAANGSINYIGLNYDGTLILTMGDGDIFNVSKNRGVSFTTANNDANLRRFYFPNSSTTDAVVTFTVQSAVGRVRSNLFSYLPVANTSSIPFTSMASIPRPFYLSNSNYPQGNCNICSSDDFSIVFIISVSLALYRSTDYGSTFQEVLVGSMGGVVCSSNGQVVYANTTGNLLYTSTNGGNSWTLSSSWTASGGNNANSLKCSADGNIILKGDRISRNGGTTWIANPDTVRSVWRSMLSDGNNFLSTKGSLTSLYYYTYNSTTNTYTTPATPMLTTPTNLNLGPMASSRDGRYIYMMTLYTDLTGLGNGCAFVYSSDYGATFSYRYGSQFKAAVLSCSTDGSVIIYTDRLLSVYRSTDYGATFKKNEEWTDPRRVLRGNYQYTYDAFTAPDGSLKYVLHQGFKDDGSYSYLRVLNNT